MHNVVMHLSARSNSRSPSRKHSRCRSNGAQVQQADRPVTVMKNSHVYENSGCSPVDLGQNCLPHATDSPLDTSTFAIGDE